MDKQQQLKSTLLQIREDIYKDPVAVAENMFGDRLDGGFPGATQQHEIFPLPWRHHLFAIGSGHGTGKSHFIKGPWPILWLLSHFPSKVYIISQGELHLKDVIFPGIREAAQKANKWFIREIGVPFFDERAMPLLTTEWNFYEGCGIYGRSPGKDKPEAIQGKHSKGPYGSTMVLVEEASGLYVEHHNSIMSYAGDQRNCIGYLGNPLHQDGPFANVLRQETAESRKWEVRYAPSTENANSVATKRLIASGKITPEEAYNGKEIIVVNGMKAWSWCEQMARDHSTESAEYQRRVLGIVPNQSDDTFIGRDLILNAIERHRGVGEEPASLGAREEPSENQLILTFDPAFSEKGDDAGMITVDPGKDCVCHLWKFRGKSSDKLEDIIVHKSVDPSIPLREIRIERDGIGGPIYQHLQRRQKDHIEAWHDGLPDCTADEYRSTESRWVWPCPPDRMVPIKAIQMGGAAHNGKDFINRKAEAWSNMKAGLRTLSIPEEFRREFLEIANVKYEYDATHRLKMESKKAYKERGNASPTWADCLALYYAQPVGDPVFKAERDVGAIIQMKTRPEVVDHDGDEWTLHMEGYPDYYDRFGHLERAWWLDRRGRSAVIWTHVDGNGCRVVWKSMSFTSGDLRSIARRVVEESFDGLTPHRYEADVACAAESSAQVGGTVSYHDELVGTIDRLSDHLNMTLPAPIPIQKHRVSGRDGLDTLDRWISNSANEQNKDGRNALFVWPRDVVMGVSEARLKQPSRAADEDEFMPQDAVGGGGPHVLCLRLLAVHSEMMEIAAA